MHASSKIIPKRIILQGRFYQISLRAARARKINLARNENQPRYTPFIVNFLTTLYTCYAELDRRFAVANAGRVTKKARIKATVLNSLTPISKADVCRILPDVSPTTVEAVLGELVRENRVRIIGNGRATRYLKQARGQMVAEDGIITVGVIPFLLDKTILNMALAGE